MNRMTIRTAGQLHRPLLVAVVSGKGGVGKSVIAFNLARQLADTGSPTLLVDCDWHFGNAHVLANVIPAGAPVTTMTADMDLAAVVTPVAKNLDLIATPSAYETNTDTTAITLHDILKRISNAGSSYDAILLDTPSGNIDIISQVTGLADINLIVVVPELTAISDGYGLFKYLAKADRHTAAHILVNRAQNGNDAEYIRRKLIFLAGKFLHKVPFDAGYLPEDTTVIDAVAHQAAVADINAEAPVMTGLAALADYVRREMADSRSGAAVSSSQPVNSETFLADIRE
ncbi:MAG: AAA family ATPase [candidate division Zixibacteria bacterium]|nr:AAA family ATPase [candidate division Zixibacteria bacterium]